MPIRVTGSDQPIDQTELLNALVDQAKDLKESRVKQHGTHEKGWLGPMVEFWRDNTLICQGFAVQVDKDLAFKAIIAGCSGLTADVALLAIDGVSHRYENEEDVEKISVEQGEYQKQFQKGDPTIGEALIVTSMSRSGNHAAATLPYSIKGKEVVWYPPQQGIVGGLVLDVMAKAMKIATAEEILIMHPVHGTPTDPIHKRLIMDKGAIGAIAQLGFAIFCHEDRIPSDCEIVKEWKK